MIEQEFVPYEQALELKQLGFDELCLGYYLASTLFISNDIVYNSTDIPVIKAPLYQQAFRWFREKRGLGHMINGIGHESFIMNIGGMLYIFNGSEFKTYEEAELACLKKLIEIAK